MSHALRVLIVGAACACVLGCTGDTCFVQEMGEDTAISLLQTNAKQVTPGKLVKSVPAQHASSTQEEQQLTQKAQPALPEAKQRLSSYQDGDNEQQSTQEATTNALPRPTITDDPWPVEVRDNKECATEFFTDASLRPMPKHSHCISKARSLNFDSLPTEIVGPGNADQKMATRDLTQGALRHLWGNSPPSVDLYFRTGCAGKGFEEMLVLLESAEFFWPNFLGHIVIVADVGDQGAAMGIPKNTAHHYKIHYEDTPALPGRLFNQYSYLHADKHCTAEYIVTIDSDCVFLVPVTPRLLFADYPQDMRVIFAAHQKWQRRFWQDATNMFYDGRIRNNLTLPDSSTIVYQENHMVSQPVTFRRDTLIRWRKFITERNGKCFAQQLVDAHHHVPKARAWPTTFCWMCIVGTWIIATPSEGRLYEMIRYNDQHSKGSRRFAAHVPYETPTVQWRGAPIPYQRLARLFLTGGLCASLGHRRAPRCNSIDKHWLGAAVSVMFSYHPDMSVEWPKATKERLRDEYFYELENALALIEGRHR